MLLVIILQRSKQAKSLLEIASQARMPQFPAIQGPAPGDPHQKALKSLEDRKSLKLRQSLRSPIFQKNQMLPTR